MKLTQYYHKDSKACKEGLGEEVGERVGEKVGECVGGVGEWVGGSVGSVGFRERVLLTY